MDYQTACDVFHYDPATGCLYWANHVPEQYFPDQRACNQFNSRQAGTNAGTPDTGGYLQVRWKVRVYRVHRVIWLISYGIWPTNHIDHKDRNRTNNRINNLRDVTQAANNINRSNNTSGLPNIFFNPKSVNRPWTSKVFSKGKIVGYGAFATEAEAIRHRDGVRQDYNLPPA